MNCLAKFIDKTKLNDSLQDIEHGQSPDGSNGISTVPKKCEKAFLARIWGNFDKKYAQLLRKCLTSSTSIMEFTILTYDYFLFQLYETTSNTFTTNIIRNIASMLQSNCAFTHNY